MMRVLFLAMLGVLGALLLRAFAFERIVVASGSMEPTLAVGTRLYVNKFIYRFQAPARGDIVVFPSPVEKKELVKRVIAVAGDEISLERKTVILNGSPLKEPYTQFTRPNEILVGDDLEIGRVPPGHVVVMGDNRDESGDSRDWKIGGTSLNKPFVPIRNIRGKLVLKP